MAVIALTIAGVPKELRAGSLRGSKTANGRSTVAFDVVSVDGTYRPAQDAVVTLTVDGVLDFAGLLEEPSEKGLVDRKGVAAIVTSVTAADYNVYPERRYINGTIPAGTHKSQIEWVRANYLDDYGVTLSGSQPDGPTLPAFDVKYIRGDEVLNDLCSATADFGEPFSWRIDNSKVLNSLQPSTESAPFNLTGDPIAQVKSDVVVATSYKHYANRVIVKVPSKLIKEYTASFTGDGSEDTFTVPTGYTIVGAYGYVENGAGQYETLTTPAFAGSATWEMDIDAGTVTRVAGAPANGTAISFKIDANYSGEGIAFDAAEITARKIKEFVKQVESVPDNETAQAIADGILARCLTPSKTVTYKTHTAGILPRQSQSIVISRRNINGTAVIGDVSFRDVGKNIIEYSITAYIDGADTNIGRGYRDVYKKWSGDITGGAMQTAPVAVAGTSNPVSAGAAPPVRSVQYNRNFSFGGDPAFTYYELEEGRSIICGGGGSSITATDFESCQVFGYDNHITDP